jgi:hypothetical protein
MDYSISIGIGTYLNLETTKYACEDAEEFHRIMQEVYDIKSRILLKNERATVAQMKDTIEKTVRNMSEGDRLFFYFAGHGISFYDEPRLSCYDSLKDISASFNTWYSLRDLLKEIERAKINALVFIDACESTISYKRGNTMFESEYMTVFSAANSNQEAMAEDEFGHGVWSHYLFSALKGTKEALEENILTCASLQDFLHEMVTEYYERKTGYCKQTPYLWGKMNGNIKIKSFKDYKHSSHIKISDVYFGIIDADNEYKKDKEAFINNYYDLNNAVKKIEEQANIQYILGKKGTGKTYIGRYLEAKNPKQIKYLSLNKFKYKSFATLAKDGKGYEPFTSIWQYVILSFFIEYIGNEEGNDFIKNYLKELFGFKVTLQQILDKRFKRGIKIENDRVKEYFTKDKENYEIESIVESFKYIIEEENIRPHQLIIDGLDEKMNEHPKYKEIINALIWSIQELNDYFFENEIQCKCILLLRRDVFDFVSGANMNKIVTGSSVTLNWVNESNEKDTYPLYDFINIRLQNSVGKNMTLKDILPESITTKGGEFYNSWSWLLNFTTYKPRDVVAFLDFCAVHCHKEEKVLTETILWNATKDYSEYFYKELQDELYGFFTDEQIFYLFDEVFPKMEMKWIDYQELMGYINRKGLFFDLEDDWILERLYAVGALGVRLDSGHEHWSYRSKVNLAEFYKTAKFKLHQGLWKKLSIW